MVYELREYTAAPGKMAALKQRFVDHAIPGWENYGIKAVAFWEVVAGENQGNSLIYLLQFPDMGAWEKSWKGFRGDQAWGRARAESEKDGPLVLRMDSRILKPTDFSPMQ